MLKFVKIADFSKKEFIVVLTLSFALIACIGLRFARDNHWNLDPVRIISAENEGKSYQIDINSADWRELTLIPGVGQKKAIDIVKYRAKHGNFHSTDELRNVEGIGNSILDAIKNMVVVNNTGE